MLNLQVIILSILELLDCVRDKFGGTETLEILKEQVLIIKGNGPTLMNSNDYGDNGKR